MSLSWSTTAVGRRGGLRVGVGLAPFLERLGDLLAEAARGPAEVGLEDLPDVHPARHAERVEHDVDRGAVLEERHVLHPAGCG